MLDRDAVVDSILEFIGIIVLDVILIPSLLYLNRYFTNILAGILMVLAIPITISTIASIVEYIRREL